MDRLGNGLAFPRFIRRIDEDRREQWVQNTFTDNSTCQAQGAEIVAKRGAHGRLRGLRQEIEPQVGRADGVRLVGDLFGDRATEGEQSGEEEEEPLFPLP